jgi:hypothetical protein
MNLFTYIYKSIGSSGRDTSLGENICKKGLMQSPVNLITAIGSFFSSSIYLIVSIYALDHVLSDNTLKEIIMLPFISTLFLMVIENYVRQPSDIRLKQFIEGNSRGDKGQRHQEHTKSE